LVIAQVEIFLYQIQERWQDAAEYAEEMRKSGVRYNNLIAVEAFSWLCSQQPERALNVISLVLQERQYQNHWLYAFIQLRLGNTEAAKQAFAAYEDHAVSLQDIDEPLLLTLWDQPTAIFERHDLSYHFPTLPPVITGLPHSVTRLPHHHSVLPDSIKTKNFTSVYFPQHYQDRNENTHSKESAQMLELEKYIDFDLHIDPNGHIVASSPEGQATDHVSIQLPSHIRLSLQLIERGQTDAKLLKEAGQALYEWLFPNVIHTHLQQTEAVARNDKAKLRLRLRVEAPEIASLPLEFIYRAAGGYFLAVNPDTVFARYLNLPLPPGNVRRREDPLHMLTIISDPSDQVRLNPDDWEMIIREAIAKPLSDKDMTMRTVKRATRKEIRNALLEKN